MLTFLGFHPSHRDLVLFLKCTSIGCIILVLYVDDMIITGNDVDVIVVLTLDLASQFAMKYALYNTLGY